MENHCKLVFQLVIFLQWHVSSLHVSDIDTYPILMPRVHPDTPDTYLCTTVRLDTNTTNYIVGFEPRAEQRTAHHMLLYGCEEPGHREQVFR